MHKQIYVKGINGDLPKKSLEADKLKKEIIDIIGTEKIFEDYYGNKGQYFEHVNFTSKRILSEKDSLIGLMIESARKTVEKSMLKTQEIDVILCAYGGTPMFSGWLYSAIIANELGVNNVRTRDFSGSCASVFFAIEYAMLLLKKTNIRHVLIVAGDNLSNYLTKYNISKYKNIPTYGDGVGSFILSLDGVNSSFQLTKLEIMQNTKFANLFVSERFKETSDRFEKEINSVACSSNMKAFVTEDPQNVCKIADKLVEKTDDTHDLIIITGNTASSRLKLLKESYQIFDTYNKFGHVGTADVILNLHMYNVDKAYPRKIIVIGWGVGYVWGGFSLLRL
ncbi:MAG: hypothetical protein LBH79_08050 [Nitrososphaerota archaeon]|jgi:3-oxoacyl-[acyl-carrier-protein] synthase III|nr:hypothetical protein [Nitrososphaerota archaeon]